MSYRRFKDATPGTKFAVPYLACTIMIGVDIRKPTIKYSYQKYVCSHMNFIHGFLISRIYVP